MPRSKSAYKPKEEKALNKDNSVNEKPRKLGKKKDFKTRINNEATNKQSVQPKEIKEKKSFKNRSNGEQLNKVSQLNKYHSISMSSQNMRRSYIKFNCVSCLYDNVSCKEM
ncbi:hypothetical protein RFI_24918 [Reticulomyxa filosa]|uniref:Uncharacterized protein n=1 Tax=Reticulomyxa filosa TaxID=46433 RepID=X6MF09_RETFI|nr:hypothetical protein RFI_24918 [Reticulomyxa filosa]|eukprot:ETO12459.1 hypothetical protein RFI_24918 [Reticulomyxa filosa]